MSERSVTVDGVRFVVRRDDQGRVTIYHDQRFGLVEVTPGARYHRWRDRIIAAADWAAGVRYTAAGELEVTVTMDKGQWRRVAYKFGEDCLILVDDSIEGYWASLPTVDEIAGILGGES